MNILKFNSLNFGLAKTTAYKAVEADLIRRAQEQGKERSARFLADKIGQKVPKGLLDVNNSGDEFVLLKQDYDSTSTYKAGNVDKTNPVHTLFLLNKKLGEIDRYDYRYKI